jgi:hypothetical protein
MRARKVAVLLAIIAVSALTLFFIVLLDAEALGAVPPPQASGASTISNGPDEKSEVEILAVLEEGGHGDLRPSLIRLGSHTFTFPSGLLAWDTAGNPATDQKG